MEKLHIQLGQFIRKERKRQGLTQEVLADKTRLSTAFIGQIERGQNTASLSSLEKIGQSLGLSLSDLFRSYAAPTNSQPIPKQKQLLSLLKDRPAQEQQYILDTVRTLVRRLDQVKKATKTA